MSIALYTENRVISGIVTSRSFPAMEFISIQRESSDPVFLATVDILNSESSSAYRLSRNNDNVELSVGTITSDPFVLNQIPANANPMATKLIVTKYGYRLYESVFSHVSTGSIAYVVQIEDLFTVANEATASGYTDRFSINGSSKIVTVTANATWQELYDYISYWISQSANIQHGNPGITIDGKTLILTTDWDLVINTGVTLTATGKKITFSGTGTWTLTGTAAFEGLMQDDSDARVPIAITNIIDGSRLLIEPAAGGVDIYNEIISGTSYTHYYTQSSETNIEIRLRNSSGSLTYEVWRTSGLVTNEAGLSGRANQILD